MSGASRSRWRPQLYVDDHDVWACQLMTCGPVTVSALSLVTCRNRRSLREKTAFAAPVGKSLASEYSSKRPTATANEPKIFQTCCRSDFLFSKRRFIAFSLDGWHQNGRYRLNCHRSGCPAQTNISRCFQPQSGELERGSSDDVPQRPWENAGSDRVTSHPPTPEKVAPAFWGGRQRKQGLYRHQRVQELHHARVGGEIPRRPERSEDRRLVHEDRHELRRFHRLERTVHVRTDGDWQSRRPRRSARPTQVQTVQGTSRHCILALFVTMETNEPM